MNERDLSYTAGIVDGEGSICMSKIRRPPFKRGYCITLIVSVSNTDEGLIRWLNSSYDGSITVHKNKDGTRKPLWIWCVASTKALKFLEMVGPYLHVKKRQAQVAIEFQSGRVHQHLTEERNDFDEDLRMLMKRLNRRGTREQYTG